MRPDSRTLFCFGPANGLTTPNLYDASGWLTTTIDLEINRANSLSYTNGQIHTHTDERALRVTDSWDALRRLTRHFLSQSSDSQ